MTMTERFVNHGIGIVAAVALLAVMSSPILPTRASHTAPSAHYLPRNFAILKFGHSGQFALSARPCLGEADSLQSDIADELDANIEDEPTVTSNPAFVSSDVLPPPWPEPNSELVSFAVARGPTASLLSLSPRPASSASRGRAHWGDARAFPSGP
jgi:hypothetical protein